jgi:hypothetical protein
MSLGALVFLAALAAISFAFGWFVLYPVACS